MNHLNRLLEYLIKDYIREDIEEEDGSEFSDKHCEIATVYFECFFSFQRFLTSNSSVLRKLLRNTRGYIVRCAVTVFIGNNSRNTANIYELSYFLRFILTKCPDDVFPYITGEDVWI